MVGHQLVISLLQ